MTDRKHHPRNRKATSIPQPPYSKPVPGAEPVPGETIPRRNSKFVDELLQTPIKAPEVTTLWELLQWSVTKHGQNRCVGSRVVKGVYNEQRKGKNKDRNWIVWELGHYLWYNFEQFLVYVKDLGSGLRALESPGPGNIKVHMFSSASLQWLAMAHGENSVHISILSIIPANCN